MPRCTHLDQVEILQVPETVAGCEECLAQGMQWVHLRMCQTCGRIGCCELPAPACLGPRPHLAASDRRSAEPGEDWSWCYLDRVAFVVTGR